MALDPFMKVCIKLHTGKCCGRIEWEHTFIYAGKQIQEAWAIAPACVYHHRGPGLDKEYNQWIAINRATDEDFAKYPRTDWQQIKRYLNKKYGKV